MVIQQCRTFLTNQYGLPGEKGPNAARLHLGQFLGELLLVKFGVGRKNMH